LDVLFKDQRVENFTISRVMFWNDGVETINKHDITAADPLRITIANGAKLIDAQIIAFNNHPNQCECTLTEDGVCAYLTFDYLDYGNGVVIQVFHTGTSSKNINIEGTIKGAKGLKRKSVASVSTGLPTPFSFDRKFKPSTRRRIYILTNFTIAVVTFIAGSFFVFIYPWETITGREIGSFIGLVYILFSFYPLLRLFWAWQNASPRGLETFDEDLLTL